MKPTTARALKMLRQAGPAGVTNHDLLIGGVGSRYGARLHELEHEHGCALTATRVRDSLWRYTLTAEPSSLRPECDIPSGIAETQGRSAVISPPEAGGGPHQAVAGQLFADPPRRPAGAYDLDTAA